MIIIKYAIVVCAYTNVTQITIIIIIIIVSKALGRHIAIKNQFNTKTKETKITHSMLPMLPHITFIVFNSGRISFVQNSILHHLTLYLCMSGVSFYNYNNTLRHRYNTQNTHT